MKQLALQLKKRKRRGVGRPKKGERASERHQVRPPVKPKFPEHVVCRVEDDVRTLRTRHVYQAVRKALITTFAHDGFHIVHASIQDSHLHLLIEAADRTVLAKGMQGFQIAAAKYINAAITKQRGERRKGRVFRDRYFRQTIGNRRQARHALAYVLNNWRKHKENRAPFAREWRVDPFSTATSFDGWREGVPEFPESYEPLPVWKAQSWLLSGGWKIYGRIPMAEVPGGHAFRE